VVDKPQPDNGVQYILPLLSTAVDICMISSESLQSDQSLY